MASQTEDDQRSVDDPQYVYSRATIWICIRRYIACPSYSADSYTEDYSSEPTSLQGRGRWLIPSRRREKEAILTDKPHIIRNLAGKDVRCNSGTCEEATQYRIWRTHCRNCRARFSPWENVLCDNVRRCINSTSARMSSIAKEIRTSVRMKVKYDYFSSGGICYIVPLFVWSSLLLRRVGFIQDTYQHGSVTQEPSK